MNRPLDIEIYLQVKEQFNTIQDLVHRARSIVGVEVALLSESGTK